MRLKSIGFVAFFLLPIAFTAASASADGPPPLPQEAFEACVGKKQGEECSANFRGHEIKGACQPVPNGEKLFCAPAGLPRPPGN